MNNTKTTKRALLSSVVAMLVCITMLIGTTFAWFTDTASTAVNKIQSGNLDVALEMSTDGTNWESAEGKTLTFKTDLQRTGLDFVHASGCGVGEPREGRTNQHSNANKHCYNRRQQRALRCLCVIHCFSSLYYIFQ